VDLANHAAICRELLRLGSGGAAGPAGMGGWGCGGVAADLAYPKTRFLEIRHNFRRNRSFRLITEKSKLR